MKDRTREARISLLVWWQQKEWDYEATVATAFFTEASSGLATREEVAFFERLM
jgi:hypothetical protein